MKKLDEQQQQDYGWFVQLRTKQQEEQQQKEKAKRKKKWQQLEKQRQAEQARQAQRQQQRKREQFEKLEKQRRKTEQTRKAQRQRRQAEQAQTQQQTKPLLNNTSLEETLDDDLPRRYSPTSSILSTEQFNDIVTTVMIILVGVGVKMFFNL